MTFDSPVKEHGSSDCHSSGSEDKETSAENGTVGSEVSTCLTSSPGNTAEAEELGRTGSFGNAAAVADVADLGNVHFAEVAEKSLHCTAPPDREDSCAAVVQNLRKLLQRPGREIQAQASSDFDLQRLRRELDDARRELKERQDESDLVAELRAREAVLTSQVCELQMREAHVVASAQSWERAHERARRELEILRLEQHIAQIDVRRAASEMEAAAVRQKDLEEELAAARKVRQASSSRSSKANKDRERQSGRKAVASTSGAILDRHLLAYRSSLQQDRDIGSKEPKAKVQEDSSSWFGFGCCTSIEGPSK